MEKRIAVFTLALGILTSLACAPRGSADVTGTVETGVTDPAAGAPPVAPTTPVDSADASVAVVGTANVGTGTETTVGTSGGSVQADAGTTSTPDAGTHAGAAFSLTYEKPSSPATRNVNSSNTGGTPSVSAYSYSLASGVSTIPYPIIDLARAGQFATGTFTDSHGDSRMGYRFTIAQGDSPEWGGAPRVEFDSATAAVQNPANGLPDSSGWNVGVIAEGMEAWFTWSMYLDPSFSLTQQWATLFQLHPGNTNYDLDSPLNGWPNPGWPTLSLNGNVLAFGLGPDAISPGQVWTAKLSDFRGKWVDFAFHGKFSEGSGGLMELYVDGQLAGAKSGSNLVYATTVGPPWYYLKQGYYRAANVPSTDTVYQTPIMVKVVADP